MPASLEHLGSGRRPGWPFSGHARGAAPEQARMVASTPQPHALRPTTRMDLRPSTPTTDRK